LTDAAVIDNWARTWQQLGRPAPHRLRSELNATWGASFRHYHDLRHLRECLGLLELWKGQGERSAEVSMALWFHTSSGAPPGRRVPWARHASRSTWANASTTLVMATRHDAVVARGIDAELLLDIDLAILGALPERFQAFERDIRKEYAAVPESLYRLARRIVLQGFIERERIYHTAKGRALLEAQARINLQGALERLAQ
jgi:predicted metal-dependent HD superfamily phosphohydrolase